MTEWQGSCLLNRGYPNGYIGSIPITTAKGSMAERSNAFVLKTKGPMGSVGSNPTTSALSCHKGNLLMNPNRGHMNPEGGQWSGSQVGKA